MNETVCADDETSIKIRKAVRNMLDKNIYLEELDFRPGPGRGKARDGIRTLINRRKRQVARV
jgi:hypothetical protein